MGVAPSTFQVVSWFAPRLSSKLPHPELQGEVPVDETLVKDVADAKASWQRRRGRCEKWKKKRGPGCGCLGFFLLGWHPTQSCGDYNKPLTTSTYWERIFFFVARLWWFFFEPQKKPRWLDSIGDAWGDYMPPFSLYSSITQEWWTPNQQAQWQGNLSRFFFLIFQGEFGKSLDRQGE